MLEEIRLINLQYRKVHSYHNRNRDHNEHNHGMHNHIDEIYSFSQDGPGTDNFDNDELLRSIPSIRFSEEVLFMTKIASETLNTHALFKKDQNQVSSQILGLLFKEQLEDIQDNLFLNLVPHF